MILSENGLIRWGTRVGREIHEPVFLGLKGSLGAGKSVFARAVARGAGVSGPIPSPTFNLVFRYATRRGCYLVHMDLYRIEETGELWELGWEELGRQGEIVVVEWPERAGGLLPGDRWEIELKVPASGPHLREVSVSCFGDPPELPGFPAALRSGGGGKG
jgi:tRNA threonylcarbamoyladenosine biosynthesis protein TsaE